MINLLGFAGSGLVVLSVTMKSIVRLRLVGMIASLVFIGYGIWLGAWPVVVANTATMSIHIVRLRDLVVSSPPGPGVERVSTSGR